MASNTKTRMLGAADSGADPLVDTRGARRESAAAPDTMEPSLRKSRRVNPDICPQPTSARKATTSMEMTLNGARM